MFLPSPYATILNEHLLPFLRHGNRLSPPVGCNKAVQALMSRYGDKDSSFLSCSHLLRLSCWKEDPNERPDFGSLQATLAALFDDVKLARLAAAAAKEAKPGRLRKIFAKVWRG